MKTQTSLVFPVWFSHVHVWQRGDISVLATGQLSFFFSWVKTRKVNLKVCVSGCVQAAILPFASEVINSACLTVCCLWRCREETWCTQHEAGVGISLNRPAQNLCFICQETTKTKCIQAWFNALHLCTSARSLLVFRALCSICGWIKIMAKQKHRVLIYGDRLDCISHHAAVFNVPWTLVLYCSFFPKLKGGI